MENDNFSTKLGEQLKGARTYKKKYSSLSKLMLQKNVASRIGISPSGLSQIENGKKIPSLITFYKLAEILNFDVNGSIAIMSFCKLLYPEK